MEFIYVRQSVDKKDSISIETQIETCRRKTTSGDVKVFADKGFSGKSTDRPEFQSMMKEIRKGHATKIIIYKLDRISRSLIDFLTMRQEFAKYNVELVSCMEDFDTSTSVGKLLLNILMMFAEMERETIQKRIKDNYYARGEKGFYLGGYAPFGYTKVETSINGKKTYTFEEKPEESAILRQVYETYAAGASLAEIARWLTAEKIHTARGDRWSPNTVSRILKNPVYVKANAEVYNYILSKGAQMNNPIADYAGENGCLVYGSLAKRKGSKFSNFENYYVTIGLHKGIIEPSTWLAVQSVMEDKAHHGNLGTGSASWLQGLIKCKCGYTCYIKRYANKSNPNKIYRYLYCRGRRNNSCPYPRNMPEVSRVEAIVEGEVLAYLQRLKKIPDIKIQKDRPEINALKIKVAQIDEKIDRLIRQLTEGSEITSQYLNRSIEQLHNEKKVYIDTIGRIQLQENHSTESGIDIDYVINHWKCLELDDKKAVAKNSIRQIILEGKDIEIKFYETD